MVVDFDISDVDAAFDEFYEEVKGAMLRIMEIIRTSPVLFVSLTSMK